jgi:hypothetical protein
VSPRETWHQTASGCLIFLELAHQGDGFVAELKQLSQDGKTWQQDQRHVLPDMGAVLRFVATLADVTTSLDHLALRPEIQRQVVAAHMAAYPSGAA